MQLKDHRLLSFEEQCAIEDRFPAVCGPSPISYAARHGLKLSKRYLDYLQKRKATANGHLQRRGRRKATV